MDHGYRRRDTAEDVDDRANKIIVESLPNLEKGKIIQIQEAFK
jgi:hypothetical protein